MRIIALIDQASVYAYSREPLTVVGTFPGSANRGVYWVSCTGVALRECRLTRKQPWDDNHQVMSCSLREGLDRHLACRPSPDSTARNYQIAFVLTLVGSSPWTLHPRNGGAPECRLVVVTYTG